MNIQSEIEFFSDLGLVDKARFVTRLIIEVSEEAKVGAGDGQDLSRLKFANEINQRLARFSYQLLSEDAARPQDDVVIRMLLGTRADKNAERIMQNAYRRVLTSFESFDTTVLLNSH
jgi:folate-dependent tRNA-U54 methylase TrmFO/GidA